MPQVPRADHPSKLKLYHLIRITHRRKVDLPITDWQQEAYDLSHELSESGVSKSTSAK